MSRYWRPRIEGGIFFFTVTLLDRSSESLVHHVEHLRQVYRAAPARLPFATNAICILPDHLHAILGSDRSEKGDRVRKIAPHALCRVVVPRRAILHTLLLRALVAGHKAIRRELPRRVCKI